MQTSTELPTATPAQLRPLAGEDPPAAVLRVVSALGGIAQTLRANGRPGSVLVTDPGLIRQVLVRGSMDEDLGLIRNFALRTAAPHGLISLTGAEHRKVRVAAAPCFRGAGLAPLQSALERRLEGGVAAFETGRAVKPGSLILDLLCRVFLEWVLGPLDPQREQELCEAEMALLEVFHHAVPDLNQLWPTPDAEGPVSFDQMVSRFFRLRTLISDTIERGPQGMMAQMDAALPPQGQGLPRSAQLTDHAIHLLLAGLDTVSQTAALLTYHLGQDPRAVETIAQEAASGIEEPPFTEAVIKEILRLYAGVPVAVRVTGAPVEVRGITIPAHRPLMAFLICMQRDERFFERPLEFLPERWSPQTTLRMDASAYMPFGTGPHICIGELAAKLILRRLIPTICRHYRIESTTTGLVPVLVRIVALPMKPPEVIFTRR
ncbi:MAG: cytochrome P450 [Phycisphaerales bacterium]